MVGISLVLASAFLIVAFAPDTEIGKMLRRTLVEAPARLLNGGPLEIFVALIVAVGLLAFVVGAPEWVALIGMADLSIYLDLAVLSFILGAVSGFRNAMRAGVLAVRRCLDGAAAGMVRLKRLRSRTRRPRKPRPRVADEEGGSWGAWAAA